MSAQLDGEWPPVSPEQTAVHLADCAGCRQWQESAHTATRRVRVGSALPSADFPNRVMDAVRADVRRRRSRRYWLVFARAVICAGSLQVLATVPLLVLARSHVGHGRVQLLGAVELVIGAGFFLGAIVVLWKDRDQTGLEMVRAVPSHAPESTNRAIAVATEDVA
jgi:predicted anti-sigma-YlaC factor YlaD